MFPPFYEFRSIYLLSLGVPCLFIIGIDTFCGNANTAITNTRRIHQSSDVTFQLYID